MAQQGEQLVSDDPQWGTPGPAAEGIHPPSGDLRKDFNAVGVNYDWFANKASKLPEPFQWPAAFLGSLAGSALETLSDPLTLATMGAGAVAGRLPKAGPSPSLPTGLVTKAREAVADQPLVKGVAKRLGYDPEAMQLQTERLQTQATRMRLEAARSRTRQAAMRTEAAEAAAPAERTVTLYRGESEAAQAGPQAGHYFSDDPTVALYYAKQGGGAGRIYKIELPESEAAKYRDVTAPEAGTHVLPQKLADRARANRLGASTASGVTPAATMRTAEGQAALRAQGVTGLQQTPAFAGLPSEEEVAQVVAAKNRRTTRAKGGTKIGRFEVVEE